MNLKELLNYRKLCPIHNKPLYLTYPEDDAAIRLVKNGLQVKDLTCKEYFKYDGTYTTTDRPCIFICVYMACKKCKENLPKQLLVSSLNGICTNYYLYRFSLTGEEVKIDGKYRFHGGNQIESLNIVQKDQFYHVEVRDKTFCDIGPYKKYISLWEMAQYTTKLKLPNFDMTHFTNSDQLIKKLQTYAIFT